MQLPQARNLDWVAISFSRGYFGSRNQTQVAYISSPALAGGFFTTEPPEKPKFTNPETLQPSPSGFFWQLYNRSMVNEIIGPWPLHSISNPSPLPGVQGWMGLKISTFYSQGWLPWQPATIFRGLPKVTSLTEQKTALPSQHRKFQSFYISLCQETG